MFVECPAESSAQNVERRRIDSLILGEIDMGNNEIPAPGTQDAIDLGCKCTVMDNSHGRGDGEWIYWYSTDCELHYDRFKKPTNEDYS